MHKKIKNQKSKIKNIKPKYKNAFLLLIYTFSLWSVAFGSLFVGEGFCDILRLKEVPQDKEGNEVEILEEREDSFIIKVPKEEVGVIKRKKPTEIKLWREKRILWEDTGDYISLHLPKEKMVIPEDYKGEEYDSAKVFKEQLTHTAGEGRPPEAQFWKGTGRIVGRILKAAQPLAGIKVRIVNVTAPTDTFSRIFGPSEGRPENLFFETATNELGSYEFKNIPLGEYDIYWSLPGTESWYRRLSEKPNITVRPAETVNYPDIEMR